MGGRRSGGISDPEGAGDRTPSTRELASGTRLTAAAAGSVSSCKHFARQPPISGQAFCGQCGQGLTGLWQGIAPASVAIDHEAAPDVAKALVAVIGITTAAPSMATMPRTKDQRWKRLHLTRSGCHREQQYPLPQMRQPNHMRKNT